jgi:uncharacterized protein DUF6941
MKLRLLLAHTAEVQAGMLYIMGAGWSEIGPGPSAFSIAGLVEVSWDETNRQHEVDITIVDADGQPFMHPTPTGDQAFHVNAKIEVGRPPGVRAGRSFMLPIALNFPPLQFRAGGDYVVRGAINGQILDEVPFAVRAVVPTPPPQQQPE